MLSNGILAAASALGRPSNLSVLLISVDPPGQLAEELASKLGFLEVLRGPDWSAQNFPPDRYQMVILLPALMGSEQKQIGTLVNKVLWPGGLFMTSPTADESPAAPVGWTQERQLSVGKTLETFRRPSPTDKPLDWSFENPATVDFSLIMPFYNEEESIVKTISELVEMLRSDQFPFEIVAVNNGSTDATEQLIHQLKESYPEVRQVKVFPNRGYGWGILHGLNSATGREVGYMAGDGQISAIDVLSTYRLFSEGSSDMAKVKRIKRGDGWIRAGISIVFNLLFSVATGFYESDTNASPKIFDRDKLPTLQLQSKDWFLDAELMMKARSAQWRIVEYEVDFLPREEGQSYIRPQALWEFSCNLAKAALRLRLGKDKPVR